jgi:hypothetical protein
VGEDVLKGVRKLEGIDVAESVLDIRIHHKLG